MKLTSGRRKPSRHDRPAKLSAACMAWLKRLLRPAMASFAGAFFFVFVLLLPISGLFPGSEAVTGRAASEPAFVGSETCANCHAAEAELWRRSQHKQAMDHATNKSVLGDFNDAQFIYFGTRSRFFSKGGKYFVETDGPDGSIGTFEIKYTFGVDPLQQYLIEFPDGRIQALSIAWDTRPKNQGGQRWLHLYPDENIRHDNALHWTKLNQNWNYMCA